MIDLSPPPRKPRAESIVPMINVVFLLLVFFLMTSELAPPAPLEVAPPSATGEEGGGPATLYLDAAGTIAFREARGEAAVAEFAAEAQTMPEETPLLRADGDVDATAVAGLLRDLTAAGLTNVSLVVAPQ